MPATPGPLTTIEKLFSDDDWRKVGPQDEPIVTRIENYVFEHPWAGSLAKQRFGETQTLLRSAVARARGHAAVVDLAPFMTTFVHSSKSLAADVAKLLRKLEELDTDTLQLWDRFLRHKTGVGIIDKGQPPTLIGLLRLLGDECSKFDAPLKPGRKTPGDLIELAQGLANVYVFLSHKKLNNVPRTALGKKNETVFVEDGWNFILGGLRSYDVQVNLRRGRTVIRHVNFDTANEYLNVS
jgi:hypothetical protein